ncbi:hypothetical protein EZV62_014489 [Acer yangbiense]|uniref:RNase H type-1 domain-containing protein n=1 Tax=Acer yangbiense TaxID=1000413 RepID=A0A5C7HUH0_9ROSI|nr:hypothetical protein EZV62_014489 [Acer yangbiense]
MTEVPSVLEHNEAIEEKPENSNYRSQQSTAACRGQRSILHRFRTSLKEPFQCVREVYGYGRVYKGWIDEKTLDSFRMGNWYGRCYLLLSYGTHKAIKLLNNGRAFLEDFLIANQKRGKEPKPSCKINWKPPEERVYKVNYDALVDRVNGRTGVGVIIRDCNGNVFASCCG